MLDYLTKFNALPQYLKDKMSDSSVLAAIKELEEKYEISLAAVVMKVMVKDLSLLDLPKYLVFEYGLDGRKADDLVSEMKEKVFYIAADYLGFESKRKDIIGVKEEEEGSKDQKKGIKSSNFFFSSEDEDEVASLTEKLGPTDKHKKVNEEKIESLVNDVIFETGVNFSSSDLSERFVRVLKTYARGVRNRIDTNMTLQKEVDKGGLGMSQGRVEEILKLLDKKNKQKEKEFSFSDEDKQSKPSEENSSQKDGRPDKTSENDSEKNQAEEEKTPKNDDKKEQKLKATKQDKPKDKEDKPKLDNFRQKIQGKTATVDRDLEYDLSSMPKKAQGGQEIKQAQEFDSKGFPIKNKNTGPEKPLDLSSRQQKQKSGERKNLSEELAGKEGRYKKRVVAPDSGKKKIEDVKSAPKLMGPIDELKNMNIVDFRRLDPDPNRAAAKIKEKIDLLEEDGFKKRMEGTAAWRQSKIFNEYIDIGRRGINLGKPIGDIIKDKNIGDQKTLKEEEFEAILELNRELKY